MVSHCTVGLLVLGSQRDEGRGGGQGEQRWTGIAFNLQAVNFLKVTVRVYIHVYAGVYPLSASVLVCACVSMRCICRSISAEVNQQAAQL